MKKIKILHLYPNEMNIYGDRGNLLTLVKRAQWHGLETEVFFHHAGQKLPENVHFVLGGGGQDSAQAGLMADVLKIGPELKAMAKAGVPMLMICGMYQLFCHRFVTHDRQEIPGIGVFDAETIASPKRMVGNVAVESDDFGMLYGFENHSGRTFLSPSQAMLGHVARGGGNNGQDGSEGARSGNVFGAYLHGPMLPNNPQFADALLGMAAGLAFGGFPPKDVDDSLAEMARAGAKLREY